MATTDDPVADLHVHTTASDGRLTAAELPVAAREAGVDCVAVTDHDRYNPALSDPVTEREGVAVVRGIELRVEADEGRVDLLGYGLRETSALSETVDRVQRDRVERARAIVDCLEDRLGVGIPLEPAEGVGRPHIARAVEESDADYDYRSAFDELIGAGCPCYVGRDIPTFERGVAVLSEACAVTSLAHPFRYRDVEWALSLATALDAVERYYPYDRAVDAERIERFATEHDLLLTGGSDAHGTTLGLAGVPREAFGRFADRVAGLSD